MNYNKDSWMPDVRKKNAAFTFNADTFMLGGDSHCATFNENVSSTYPLGNNFNNHCWIGYWLDEVGYKYKLLQNVAVGGKRTDEFITEQLPTILARKPGFVVLSLGTNDCIQNRTLAATIANLKIIFTTLAAANIKVRFYIAPIYITGIAVNYTKFLFGLHSWIYDYFSTKQDWIVYDGQKVSVDVSNVNGSALVSHLRSDGIHVSPLGGYSQGVAFAQKDISIFGDGYFPQTYSTPYEISSAGDEVLQLFRLPNLLGSRAETNPGMSGTTPGNGFYSTRNGGLTGVNSVVAGSNEQLWILDMTATANDDQGNQIYGLQAADYPILAGPANRRRLVRLEMDVEIDNSTTVKGILSIFSITVNGVGRTVVWMANYNADASRYPQLDRSFRIHTPLIEIPANGVVTAGTLSIGTKFAAAGTCKTTVRKWQIRDCYRYFDGV